MGTPRGVGEVEGDGGGGGRRRSRPVGQPRDQRWLAAAEQVHSSTTVPLAVRLWSTSRHRPDCVPRRVPSELRVHCWFVPPLQSQICTFAPAAAFGGASRHLPSAWTVWP